MDKELIFNWFKIFDSRAQALNTISLHQMYTLRKGLKKIVIIHTKNGLFALEDACPHKLAALSQGQVNERGEIICFWHQYTFDPLSGEEVTGKNIRPCKTYPLREQADGFYLGIPETPPQDEFSF